MFIHEAPGVFHIIPSDSFPYNKQTHKEDHDEEYPHKKAIHNFGNFPPLPISSLCGLLFMINISDVLNIPQDVLLME